MRDLDFMELTLRVVGDPARVRRNSRGKLVLDGPFKKLKPEEAEAIIHRREHVARVLSAKTIAR